LGFRAVPPLEQPSWSVAARVTSGLLTFTVTDEAFILEHDPDDPGDRGVGADGPRDDVIGETATVAYLLAHPGIVRVEIPTLQWDVRIPHAGHAPRGVPTVAVSG